MTNDAKINSTAPVDCSSLTDEQLLESIKLDNTTAFDCLYLRHSQRVYKLALRRMGRTVLAEEATQNIFWRIFEKRTAYDPKYLGVQWIFVIARSEVGDLMSREKTQENRRVKNSDEVLSQMQDMNPIIIGGGDFESYLEGLDPQVAEVLRLRFAEDLDFAELSQRLGLSAVNLRQMVSRALKKIRFSNDPLKITKGAKDE